MFPQLAIMMPAKLLPMLRKRTFEIFVWRLYDQDIIHDLSNQELIDLDNFLLDLFCEDCDEATNLVIDGRILGILIRFIRAERALANIPQIVISHVHNKPDYWNRLGELLYAATHPVRLQKLSFSS